MDMRMLASHLQHECVWLEATTDNLDYIIMGVRSTLGQSSGRYPRSDSARQAVDESCPHVFMCSGRTNAVYCQYRNAEGTRKTCTKNWRESDIPEVNHDNMMVAARVVEENYRENNAPAGDGAAAGGDSDGTIG